MVGQEFQDGEFPLAVGLEARKVLGHGIGEPEQALFHQLPDGGCDYDLRVGEQQPERVAVGLGRRPAAGLPEGPLEHEFAAAGEGDLRTRIAALLDMGFDRPDEPGERGGIEAVDFRVGGHGCSLYNRGVSEERRRGRGLASSAFGCRCAARG